MRSKVGPDSANLFAARAAEKDLQRKEQMADIASGNAKKVVKQFEHKSKLGSPRLRAF